ncbi:MAG: hypothetical protein BWY21_01628 [Parcubacteria group bacterium ADurb.Bin216]|nr:MAG: hypothetical protein BWY21_01628 [Parcubacteria group bacterium ADurb.Bin216]
MQTLAWDLGIIGIGDKEYLELSRSDTKKILGSLPKVLDKEWKQSIVESKDEKESTLYSFLKRSTTFDFWNYALADMPMDLAVNALKLCVDYYQDGGLSKALIGKAEDMSVESVKQYLGEYLSTGKSKVSFGAFKGGVSGDNKEVIFQYIILYSSEGEVVIRIYSPQEIVPPDSKGSYGGAIAFTNFLEEGEVIPPFIMQVNASTKRDILNQIVMDYEKQVLVSTIFNDSVPDISMPIVSWERRYIYDPVNKLLSNIPFVGDILASKITPLDSGDFEILAQEVSVIEEQDTSPVIEPVTPLAESLPAKISTSVAVTRKNTSASAGEIINTVTTTPDKEAVLAREKAKEEGEVIAELFEDTYDEKKRKEYTILIIQELLKRRTEEKKVLLKAAEVIQEEETDDSEDLIDNTCEKNDSAIPARKDIVFSEIAWMGSKSSSSAEWIELTNNGTHSVDLFGWKIYDDDSKLEILITDHITLKGGGYLLLERGEEAVPNLSADLLYTGALANSKETLYLFDRECLLQDIVKADPSWPAGNNSEKRTMERDLNYSWYSYSGDELDGIMGTPRKQNSPNTRTENVTIPKTSSSSYSSSGVSSTPISYCSQANTGNPIHSPVIINEIAWMGTLTSSNDEWIELRNVSDENVSLAGWQLLDKAENIKIVFTAQDVIPSQGFYLLERTNDTSVPGVQANLIYSGSLNDKDETLKLFNKDCQIVDEVIASPDWIAGNGPEKKSMERGSSFDWHTYQNSSADEQSGLFGTPKKTNTIIINNDPQEGQDDLPEEDPTEEEEQEEEDVPPPEEGEQLEEASNPEEESDNPPEEKTEKQESEDDDPQEGEDNPLEILSIEGRVGEGSDQVVLEWSKTAELGNYIIYFSIGEDIDHDDLVSIDTHTSVILEEDEDNYIAHIPNLYLDKEYHFLVKKVTDGTSTEIFSQEIVLKTSSSSHVFPYRYGDHTNRNNFDFAGPDSSWTTQIALGESSNVDYISPIIIDKDYDSYVQMRKNGTNGLACFDKDYQQKWFYPVLGGAPTIAIDGTIYYATDQKIIALSPSGRLKWEKIFDHVISKDILLRDNSLYIIAKADNEIYPSLYSVEDHWSEGVATKLIEGSQIIDGAYLSHTSIVEDGNGNMYFGINNQLVKFSNGTFEVREIETEYSNDYSFSRNHQPQINKIVIGEGDRVYINAEEIYIAPGYPFNGVIAINPNNLQEDLWTFLSRSRGFAYVSGIDGNNVYISETASGTYSGLVSLSADDGSIIWKKTWSSGLTKEVIFIDNQGLVYIRNGDKVSAFNPDNINNTQGNQDIVYDLSVGPTIMFDTYISATPEQIVFVFRDKVMLISK